MFLKATLYAHHLPEVLICVPRVLPHSDRYLLIKKLLGDERYLVDNLVELGVWDAKSCLNICLLNLGVFLLQFFRIIVVENRLTLRPLRSSITR